MDLKNKLRHLPEEPGVYLFKDEKQRIIYVGKAKSLNARVNSYFRNPSDLNPKTAALMRDVVDFDVMLVNTELDALLLERTLIRDHSPRYNILLRDDKDYPLLKIDYQNPWPRIRKVRRRDDETSTYLGPYGSAFSLNQMLDWVFRVFPLVRCSEHEFATAKRPCNYYHMKKCLGPCTLDVDQKAYHQMVHQAQSVIEGDNKSVVSELKAQMRTASDAMRYELAAIYRDQIQAFKDLGENQTVVLDPNLSVDIIGSTWRHDWISFHVVFLRKGKIVANNHFNLANPVQEPQQALESFLIQFYDEENAHTPVILPLPIEDPALISRALGSDRVFRSAKTPAERKLVQIANKNARFGLEEHLRKIGEANISLEALKRDLRLADLPRRIECVDISHIQGTATVAAIVSFLDGKPDRKRYRLYNLSDEQKPDDYGSIRDVMVRRFKRALREPAFIPQLIVIDGGKGQLQAAMEAKDEFPELNITLVGLAKARALRSASGELVYSNERIFFSDQESPLELRAGSSTFSILTHLRDEAHRFALKQHRKRRSKLRQQVSLTDVKGIGPKLAQRIYAELGDFDSIKKASIERLQEIPGINQQIAEAIYRKYHHEG